MSDKVFPSSIKRKSGDLRIVNRVVYEIFIDSLFTCFLNTDSDLKSL